MPYDMPDTRLITIQKRNLPSDYIMPQMEMASTHYSIGFLISGDRRIITPRQQFDAHAGEVMVMPPMIYHRTFPISDHPYVNYLVKISQQLADQFRLEIDAFVWKDVFDTMHLSFSDEDSETIQRMLNDMENVQNQHAHYRDTLLKGMLYRLVVFLWEKNTIVEPDHFEQELSKEVMDAMYYIEQHYSEAVGLKETAEAIGFSQGHLSRLFASQAGIPFSEYLINVRVRHVKQLLINTDLSVSEIAYRTGFSNADYLSACFHKREGMTPSAFRKGASTLKR